MHGVAQRALVLSFALLALSPSAGGGPPGPRLPGTHELSVADGVELAAGGGNAVFSSGCGTSLWNGHTPPRTLHTCADGCGRGIDLLAVSRTTAAWTCLGLGLDHYISVGEALLPSAGYRNVAFFYDDDTGGHEVEALDALGTRLVFEVATYDENGNVADSTTYLFDPRATDGVRCPDDGGPESTGASRGCTVLAAAAGCKLLTAGGSAIVESCPDALLVLDARGARVWSGQPLATSTASAALDAPTLEVLDGLDLRRYDLATGRLVGSRKLTSGLGRPVLTGAAAGVVAVERGSRLHLIRQADGADRTLSSRDGTRGLSGALGESGLFYSYTTRHGKPAGRVGFAATRDVRALFGAKR